VARNMAEKPEWANRRNVGGEWFAHDSSATLQKLQFGKKVYDGNDEFKKWDYLKNPNDLKPWEVEKGGSKWSKPGLPRRRKKDQIRPDEQRLRDEARKERIREKTLAVRRVEIARNEKPHAYKDIISWEEDRLLMNNPKRPLKAARPMLVQNTEGRVERMTKETAAEMRSSKNRFFCEPVVDPQRQQKLQNGGLYHPRKASVLGNSTDSTNCIESFGAADALSHAVYGGKALKPEWDLKPVEPKSHSSPEWFGLKAHERTQQPAKQPPPPKWWPKESK